MRSDRPKPLHRICGRPMVLHVIHALELLHPVRTVIVVGHGAELVTKRVQETAPAWANVAFVEPVESRAQVRFRIEQELRGDDDAVAFLQTFADRDAVAAFGARNDVA